MTFIRQYARSKDASPESLTAVPRHGTRLQETSEGQGKFRRCGDTGPVRSDFGEGENKRALCSAYVVGEINDPDAVVIRSNDLPEEPTAFGTDAEAILRVIGDLTCWTCVNTDTEVACQLGPLMEARRLSRSTEEGRRVRDRPRGTNSRFEKTK